jgi:hypothetical protein
MRKHHSVAVNSKQASDTASATEFVHDTVRALHRVTTPFPFFDQVRVGALEHGADVRQRLAAPVVELGNSGVDPLRSGDVVLGHTSMYP